MTEEVVDTAKPVTILRRLDPEDAQLALQQLQSILKRPEVVDALARRQEEDEEEDSSNLLEGLLHRQHENEIRAIINDLHPSDIAFILESLRSEERRVGKEVSSRAYSYGSQE